MATAEHITSTLAEMLCWDRNPPALEWERGFEDGRRVALYDIANRAELLRLLAAMDRGRLDFLEEIRRAEFIASSPAATAPLPFIEALLFGAAAGGITGNYGRAFCCALRVAGQFARSLH